MQPGQRVAHLGIDDERGSARVGVVRERLGEGPDSLVMVRWDDTGGIEGFDERELTPLVGYATGPTFLSMGQFTRWVRRCLTPRSKRPPGA